MGNTKNPFAIAGLTLFLLLALILMPGSSSGSVGLTGRAVANTADCWTGNFTGNDTSGYEMNITIVERNGSLEGGWTYYHKAQQKEVTAVIVSAVIDGDTVRGRWKQTKGIIAEGDFQWNWLSGERCKAFEGIFGGTRFWNRMARQ